MSFFAPKAGYAASAPFGMEADELKSMIRRFHSDGIAVILDVVFNHTAEGNENGPSISYKGIDNRTYYLLTPDGYYFNFSGCGNTMNCNNPVVQNVVLDALRYWVSSYHVDGFRFDLASILSRDEDGTPMIDPPLLDSIAHDAVLGKCMLIAEAWDAGGLYQVGSFPSFGRWAEWNGKYRDCLRRFIKGGAEFANTQWGNNNAYCQDNEISWLDWSYLDKNKDLFEYVKNLIAFRKAHPVLSAGSYDTGHNSTGYPELSFHSTKPREIDQTAPELAFACIYAEDSRKYGTRRDSFIYIAVNAHWEEHRFELPIIPEKYSWKLAFEAYGIYSEPGSEKKIRDQSGITLGARSTAVLIAERR